MTEMITISIIRCALIHIHCRKVSLESMSRNLVWMVSTELHQHVGVVYDKWFIGRCLRVNGVTLSTVSAVCAVTACDEHVIEGAVLRPFHLELREVEHQVVS